MDIAFRKKNFASRPTTAPKPRPCFRCDGKHSPDTCRFKEATCNFCSKQGHIASTCLSRKHADDPDTESTLIPDDDSASAYELFHIHSERKVEPLLIMLNINGRQLEMEVDTGAAVSLISRSAYDSLWNVPDKPLLKSSPYRLTTYIGEII